MKSNNGIETCSMIVKFLIVFLELLKNASCGSPGSSKQTEFGAFK
uniref:Uncharacterized protein n=1 Tax=Rhizophora mucronata TaxID=61149 RepID=A0A2P2NGU2_RHIMU